MSNPRTLTTADRCDRCGAQAFVAVDFPQLGAGLALLFCGHHYARHATSIGSKGGKVAVDARATINAHPSISASV